MSDYKIHYFKSVGRAFYDKRFYREVVQQWDGVGFLYLWLLYSLGVALLVITLLLEPKVLLDQFESSTHTVQTTEVQVESSSNPSSMTQSLYAETVIEKNKHPHAWVAVVFLAPVLSFLLAIVNLFTLAVVGLIVKLLNRLCGGTYRYVQLMRLLATAHTPAFFFNWLVLLFTVGPRGILVSVSSLAISIVYVIFAFRANKTPSNDQ